MLVFAPQASNRLSYILDYLLTERLGINYKLTDKLDYFERSQNFKINYSNLLVEGCLNIPLIPLLFEENIYQQKTETRKDGKWHQIFFCQAYAVLPDFKTSTKYLPFDFFAASFYLLSRYEEYLPNKRDRHKRFKATSSLAFRENFLEIPLVDIWIEQFKEYVQILYPSIEIKETKFQQINTIDVDFAYKYWGQSNFALFRKFIGSILKGKPDKNCLVKPEKDPYDCYSAMLKEANQKNCKTVFFFLLADYGAYDKNISPQSKTFFNLVQNLKKNNECGIHPSYRSNIHNKKLKQELINFENLTGQKPLLSRQHFLKLNLPSTYENLEKEGVLQDFTMAYSDAIGFRASTCFPFPFFNLLSNQKSAIQIHPSCLMDVVFKNQLLFGPNQAIEKIKQLKVQVKAVNGQFVSIWHNSSFDETQGWKGWNEVYRCLFE